MSEFKNRMIQDMKLHRSRKWLFPSRRRVTHLPDATARLAFNQTRNECGFNDGFRPHSLRHSFASHMLSQGVDILITQILLGQLAAIDDDQATGDVGDDNANSPCCPHCGSTRATFLGEWPRPRMP